MLPFLQIPIAKVCIHNSIITYKKSNPNLDCFFRLIDCELLNVFQHQRVLFLVNFASGISLI